MCEREDRGERAQKQQLRTDQKSPPPEFPLLIVARIYVPRFSLTPTQRPLADSGHTYPIPFSHCLLPRSFTHIYSEKNTGNRFARLLSGSSFPSFLPPSSAPSPTIIDIIWRYGSRSLGRTDGRRCIHAADGSRRRRKRQLAYMINYGPTTAAPTMLRRMVPDTKIPSSILRRRRRILPPPSGAKDGGRAVRFLYEEEEWEISVGDARRGWLAKAEQHGGRDPLVATIRRLIPAKNVGPNNPHTGEPISKVPIFLLRFPRMTMSVWVSVLAETGSDLIGLWRPQIVFIACRRRGDLALTFAIFVSWASWQNSYDRAISIKAWLSDLLDSKTQSLSHLLQKNPLYFLTQKISHCIIDLKTEFEFLMA